MIAFSISVVVWIALASVVRLSRRSALAILMTLSTASAQEAKDRTQAITDVITIIEENRNELDKLRGFMMPESEALDSALERVDAALLESGITDAERLDNAAVAMDDVLVAIDDLTKREAEFKRLFKVQIRAIAQAWRFAGEPAGGRDAAKKERQQNVLMHGGLAATLALDEETPEEWRHLFQMAHELAAATADVESSTDEQSAKIWKETTNLLQELRDEVYKRYGEDVRSFQQLRGLRRSKALQQVMYKSSGDLERLREAGKGLRQASKVLVQSGQSNSSATDVIRRVLENSRSDKAGKPTKRRASPADQRRRLRESAKRYRKAVADARGGGA